MPSLKNSLKGETDKIYTVALSIKISMSNFFNLEIWKKVLFSFLFLLMHSFDETKKKEMDNRRNPGCKKWKNSRLNCFYKVLIWKMKSIKILNGLTVILVRLCRYSTFMSVIFWDYSLHLKASHMDLVTLLKLFLLFLKNH